MVIKTIFSSSGRFEVGEVEVHLMPGIPNLHVVGSPDPQIREAGLKLKLALRASGFKWPRGQQIVVNLRPNHFRKTSAGAELAVALGVLSATQQLSESLTDLVKDVPVYGEVTLDGRVIAPHDLPLALRAAEGPLLPGPVGEGLREGEWCELESLRDEKAIRKARFFDWEKFFERPSLPPLTLHPEAALALSLSAHMGLHVLLAGPQGSGKSTWAKILYALSSKPEIKSLLEREEWVGRDDFLKWRPLESPHHSSSPLAMVGGSYPIQPGVVTRAHGGILLMDEFLEFGSTTLESLREPLENGFVEIARRGARERLPAKFQMIATTNLCPCGKLFPKRNERCGHRLSFCSSTSRRLSGPLLDRFDLLLFSHSWTVSPDWVSLAEVSETLSRLDNFRAERGEADVVVPEWIASLGLNFRRQKSLLRVARGLADMDQSRGVESEHFSRGLKLVSDSIAELNQLFA